MDLRLKLKIRKTWLLLAAKIFPLRRVFSWKSWSLNSIWPYPHHLLPIAQRKGQQFELVGSSVGNQTSEKNTIRQYLHHHIRYLTAIEKKTVLDSKFSVGHFFLSVLKAETYWRLSMDWGNQVAPNSPKWGRWTQTRIKYLARSDLQRCRQSVWILFVMIPKIWIFID